MRSQDGILKDEIIESMYSNVHQMKYIHGICSCSVGTYKSVKCYLSSMLKLIRGCMCMRLKRLFLLLKGMSNKITAFTRPMIKVPPPLLRRLAQHLSYIHFKTVNPVSQIT